MTTLAQVKQAMRNSGLFYIDSDPWPTEARYILVVGSKSSKLHPQTTASFIQDIVGGAVASLPKDPKAPNVYYFSVGIEEGQAKASKISALEDAGFAIAAVYRYAMMSADQTLWSIKQLRGASGSPTFWAPSDTVAPNTWVWLQVRTKKAAAMPTSSVKETVEASGQYKVIDPLSGVSGFFESTIWREDYIGQDYTNVLFSPGSVSGVSAMKLQSEIFATNPHVELWFFSTPELNSDQEKAESMSWVKDAEGSIGGVAEGIGTAATSILDMVGGILKTVPVLLWIGLGAVALYGGVKVYGAFRGRKKRSRA